MGCDIHGVFQKKTENGWEDIPEEDINFQINRHYTLFSVLAGVRNYNQYTPIAPIRGLPKDFSTSVQGGDGDTEHNGVWMGDHSFSYLTGNEVIEWFWKSNDSDLKDEISYFIKEIVDLMILHKEIRFVFGFDN